MIEKREPLYDLLKSSMLYPSRNKIIHRVIRIERKINNYLIVHLGCGKEIILRDSKKGRVARWLRKGYYLKYCKKECKECKSKLKVIKR